MMFSEQSVDLDVVELILFNDVYPAEVLQGTDF
jgi:hypothetical protein